MTACRYCCCCCCCWYACVACSNCEWATHSHELLTRLRRQESMWVARQALHGKRLPSCRTCQTRIYFWQTNKTIKLIHTHTHANQIPQPQHNLHLQCVIIYRKLFDFLATFDLKTKSSNQDDIYTHTYKYRYIYIDIYIGRQAFFCS